MSEQLSRDLASLRIDRSGPKPPNRFLRALLVLSLLGAIGWGANKVGRPYVESQLFKTEVGVTEISAISPTQASVDLTSTGYVVPQKTARVGAKVVSRIIKTELREGQLVKQGDVLFELDGLDQEALIASAKARAAAAGARIATARAQRAELELELGRQEKLLESGAVPKGPVDDLRMRLASSDALIKAAEAETAAAYAEVEALKVGLKNLTITSPIDGVIALKPAALGDITNPAMPLADMFDPASLVVEVDVPEARLALAKPGGPCEISLDALPAERFKGLVVEVGPRLNRAKATALVKVRFVKPPELLRPEMSARVSFLQSELDEAALKAPPTIVVPASAVVDRGGAKAVFVLDGGKVRLVMVSLGDAMGAGFVLRDGPPPGTRVVKDPPAELKDGQAVKEKSG
ncbi:MAG: efflux RND transporter periplasmic adaptor subunit [Polyangiaceae bacterium]